MSKEFWTTVLAVTATGDTIGTEEDMAFAIGFFVIFLVIYLLILALSLANYIMTSLSLYTIANNRHIANPWLAWLPVGSSWNLGAIVDHHEALHGMKRKWRVTLLVLNLIGVGGFILVYVLIFVMAFALGLEASTNNEPPVEMVFSFLIPVYLLMLVCIAVLGALSICQYICYYKVFEALVPEKAVKYTLISLLVPFGSAVCLMKCRHSPLGIPQPPVYIPAPIANMVPPPAVPDLSNGVPPQEADNG